MDVVDINVRIVIDYLAAAAAVVVAWSCALVHIQNYSSRTTREGKLVSRVWLADEVEVRVSCSG